MRIFEPGIVEIFAVHWDFFFRIFNLLRKSIIDFEKKKSFVLDTNF